MHSEFPLRPPLSPSFLFNGIEVVRMKYITFHRFSIIYILRHDAINWR